MHSINNSLADRDFDHVNDKDTKPVTLYHGDCLHVLRQLPDHSIDLSVTSPPYADARKKTYGGIPHAEYVEWFLPIGAELLRVLKPDGSFVLNIKESVVKGERHAYVSDLIRALREQGWRLIDEYVWVKPNPYPGWWPTRLRDAFERCFHLSPTTRCFMDQDAVKVPIGDWVKNWNPAKARTDLRRRGTKSNFWTRDRAWAGKTHVLPTNVLQFPTENKNKKHPAVFPRQLPEFFVKLFSQPGEVVLDPFAGSGTTLSVAAALGRRAIGIELKDEDVVNMEAEFGIDREPQPIMLPLADPANDAETRAAITGGFAR
jgi:DNA modification methylase